MSGQQLIDAISYDELEIVRELIKAGANREADSPRLRSRSSLDLQNCVRWTALMNAANNSKIEMVRELLKAGANREADSPRLRSRSSLDLRDIVGHTALNLSGSDEIRNLITKYQSIRENLKRLQDLQSSRLTYLFIIPKDLIGLIKNELEDEKTYLAQLIIEK